MPKRNFCLICFLILGQIAISQTSKENRESIIDYLNGITYPEFSGVVLLSDKDSVLFEKAYGYSSIEHEFENNLHTLFNVASITKIMTAVATLQLVDKGLLDLDAPVGRYLPDYPKASVRDSVTTYQLLTHTAGLNNFLVDDFKEMGKLNLKALKDYLPLFASKPLLFTPGTEYSYSAAGYVVLGLLIEKLSGKSYHEYMKEHFFEKAGMKRTIAIPIDSIVKNKASGYTSYFGESDHYSKNDSYIGYANPAGFYYSTANDLNIFFDARQRLSIDF